MRIEFATGMFCEACPEEATGRLLDDLAAVAMTQRGMFLKIVRARCRLAFSCAAAIRLSPTTSAMIDTDCYLPQILGDMLGGRGVVRLQGHPSPAITGDRCGILDAIGCFELGIGLETGASASAIFACTGIGRAAPDRCRENLQAGGEESRSASRRHIAAIGIDRLVERGTDEIQNGDARDARQTLIERIVDANIEPSRAKLQRLELRGCLMKNCYYTALTCLEQEMPAAFQMRDSNSLEYIYIRDRRWGYNTGNPDFREIRLGAIASRREAR